jgi:hypothetical protein
MTPDQSNSDSGPWPQPFRWTRTDATQARHDFHHSEQPPPSQRQFAREHGLPRSTLGYWLHRPQHPDLEPELVAFLDSPTGYRFLRRLVAALHLVFHLAGDAGLRPLSRFLELTQLDRFVAPSLGAQQALAVRLQDTLIAYADEQKQRLSACMPARKISACLDENFHGSQPCLVAVEPESGFLLLEAYYPQRDGDTWTAALKQALTGMPVEVIQVTSDQAKGLIACARDGLEAQHTPDLFHVQRELSKATSLPLHRQVETAQKEVARAQSHTQVQRQRQQDYQSGPHPPGRPPDFASDIHLAENVQRQATTDLTQRQQRQQQAREAVRGVADDYHPFDAHNGQPVTATAVSQRLEQRMQTMEQIIDAAQLGESSRQALAKTRRWLVPRVASLSWFWEMVDELISGLGLTAAQRRAFPEQLLAGLYWQRQASRGRDAEQRQQRRALADRLVGAAWSAAGALGQLAQAKQQEVTRVAAEAVALFVRSSSCVEGRNGRLSLYHHGQGPLREARLRSLTAVHNFVVEDRDGRTAAERFFGGKPEPVFEWLLERMPELPRPAPKRPSASQKATAAA